MSDARRDRGPRSLAPRRAVERWLNRRSTEMSDESIESYYYRLKLFVEWCEGNDIETVGELTGWDIDTYENVRSGEGVASTTLQNEMKTLRRFIEYLERIEAVDEGLAAKVHIPDVPESEQTDEEKLPPERAEQLLTYYRNTPAVYGTDRHAWLELAWHTGARMGGIRALDIRDYNSEEDLVEFHHRPDTGTPLKKKLAGERPVGFPEEVADVLDRYIEYHRHDVNDEHGRQPLFTSTRGRPSTTTIRTWSYMVTFPCHHSACPHGMDPDSCEYKHRHRASKCPSSRSPHKIRTGSIIWQRDLGFPPEVVAERVNATVDTIEQYYDHASALERLEERRRPFIQQMEF